ncbi:MAG: RNA polymerase sigma factor [Xanthomonadales bacterium]|nr:RNA polymerase sigma factor [Xanthomonadales bacterium]
MSARFRQLVDQHQDQVWTLARYLLKDPAEAEDVAQETFEKLWHHQHDVDPERVRPWQMRVTRNACQDRIRRRRPEEPVDEERETASDAPVRDPAGDAERAELGRWLQRAIAGLREPYRSLVVLRDVHQHSYEEVAGALELSLAQVKVYLHRARKQLREQLAEVAP